MADSEDEQPDDVDRLFRAMASVAPPRSLARIAVEGSRSARRAQVADQRRDTLPSAAGRIGLLLVAGLVGWQVGSSAAVDLRLLTSDQSALVESSREIATLFGSPASLSELAAALAAVVLLAIMIKGRSAR